MLKRKAPSLASLARAMPEDLLEEASDLLRRPAPYIVQRASDLNFSTGQRQVAAFILRAVREGDVDAFDALMDRIIGPVALHE